MGTLPSQKQTSKHMSKITTLEQLLIHEIKDLYSAETQLVKALPKMAKNASHESLREAFESHLEETKGHVDSLEKIAEILGTTPRGVTCAAMKGLVEEGSEAIDQEGDPTLRDISMIAVAQKVEHYEIAGYGTSRAIAEMLGQDEVAKILQATLDQEGAADKKLTAVTKKIVAKEKIASKKS